MSTHGTHFLTAVSLRPRTASHSLIVKQGEGRRLRLWLSHAANPSGARPPPRNRPRPHDSQAGPVLSINVRIMAAESRCERLPAGGEHARARLIGILPGGETADKRSRKGMGSTDRVRRGRLGERTPLSILRPSISFNGWHGLQPRGAGCRWDHGGSSLCTCERLAARGEPLSCLPSLPIPS
jgi:hypothetical protein